MHTDCAEDGKLAYLNGKGQVDVQIRKRKKLADQSRSMSGVEGCETMGTELREERWHTLRQWRMALFPTIFELWSQKDLGQVGHQKHRRDRWTYKSGNSKNRAKQDGRYSLNGSRM